MVGNDDGCSELIRREQECYSLIKEGVPLPCAGSNRRKKTPIWQREKGAGAEGGTEASEKIGKRGETGKGISISRMFKRVERGVNPVKVSNCTEKRARGNSGKLTPGLKRLIKKRKHVLGEGENLGSNRHRPGECP